MRSSAFFAAAWLWALAAAPAVAATDSIDASPRLVTSCTNTISCGQTIQGALVAACQFQDGSAYDLFSFTGTAGEPVTITATSNDFPLFVDLEEPTTFNSLALGTGSTAVIDAVLDTSGQWWIAVSNFSESFQAGNYTLSLACNATGPGTSPGTCTPSSATLCLQGGRFAVSATYDAGASGSGPAQVVQLTGDTGYLWFFDAANVESVVKVLNGCDLGGYYWFFAGGLTNVAVKITVVDETTGATRTYDHAANTPFAPIQDTQAFATCP